MRSKKRLYPFQVAGARFLAERRFAILADDARLGKTAQALAALREVGSAALVLAPTLIKGAWEAEIALTEGVSVDRTAKGVFPSRGLIRVMTPNELLRRKLSPKAAPEPSSVLVIDEPYRLSLAPDGRLFTKLARLCDAFVRADGAVWILCVPDLIKPDQFYRLLGVTGFMLRRRILHDARRRAGRAAVVLTK